MFQKDPGSANPTFWHASASASTADPKSANRPCVIAHNSTKMFLCLDLRDFSKELQCNHCYERNSIMKTSRRKARKSAVLTIRMDELQMSRLSQLARKLAITPSETAARLIEEGLRRQEFAFIDFRSTGLGRSAIITGSRLTVSEVIIISRMYEYDLAKTAEHLSWPTFKVQAAFNYWNAFRDEVDTEIEDRTSRTLQDLKNLLPQMEVSEYSPASGGVLMVQEDASPKQPKTTTQKHSTKPKSRKHKPTKN